MAPTPLSLIRLDSYDDQNAVDAALAAALVPLGGMAAFVRPGDRVLLKANLLAPAHPDEAVTTHPAIVCAAIRAVKAAGASRIRVGDGPGVGTTAEVMRSSGILEICEREGAEMAVFEPTAVYENNDNILFKRIELTTELQDNDVIITLPKLKTHVQMGYTGALKNQYGLIPGTRKAEYHFRLQDRDRLADLMIDINRTANMRLAIMDAVVGMEGPGPHGGKPRKIGAIIVSGDLSAVDVVGCSIIGFNPNEYPLLQAAARGNYGTTNLEDIQIHGATIQELHIPDYKLVKTPANIMRILPLPQWLLRWLRRQIADRPYIDRKKCIKCLKCKNGCPIKPPAIDPLIPKGDCLNHNTCIRCYCCHEFCPVDAIELRKSWIERIFHLRAIGTFGCKTLGWIAEKFVRRKK